jgi:hypothetical protein
MLGSGESNGGKAGAMKAPYELFGIECGPGWKTLYEPLIELCKKEGVAISQIKEKFGTLRFYVGSAPEHVYEAIDVAERKSAETCENCGARGERIDDGWIRTLCAQCAGERQTKRLHDDAESTVGTE